MKLPNRRQAIVEESVSWMAMPRPVEHDVVALLADLPAHGLRAGDTGTVVYCYSSAGAIEVEFLDAAGRTKAIVTLDGVQLLKLNLVPAVAT